MYTQNLLHLLGWRDEAGIGAIGVLLAPMLAAVGAIAALVTKCTIVVERRN